MFECQNSLGEQCKILALSIDFNFSSFKAGEWTTECAPGRLVQGDRSLTATFTASELADHVAFKVHILLPSDDQHIHETWTSNCLK